MEIQKMRLALMASTEPGDEKVSEFIRTQGIKAAYLNYAQHIYVEKIEEEIAGLHCGLLFPEDELWPEQLNDLQIPALGLCIRGDSSLLKESSLAIVGTRNPTAYGIKNAQEFAAGFVDRDYVITSGGAYGIDSAAHKGALIAEGRTIAVTASGLDIPYPAGNQRLFSEIEENGAVVTEYLPGVQARPFRFLVRNRIIAALSDATLVVEAAFRSGSLRTARDAAEIFRPVFAIPGPINAPTSDGCHRLIGERKAELITSVADAYELLEGLSKDAILSM
jgi:DNA processing protein